jgi:hypothetical protein
MKTFQVLALLFVVITNFIKKHWPIIGIILILLFWAIYSIAGELPDSKLTPGASRVVDVNTLCTTSTKLVRNVPEAEKKQVYKNYNMTGDDRSSCKEGYEIDHLISLELGGSNDIANLWPQDYCGTNNAHMKDKLENQLHKEICEGKMTIKQAQDCISTDWISCYQKVMQ